MRFSAGRHVAPIGEKFGVEEGTFGPRGTFGPLLHAKLIDNTANLWCQMFPWIQCAS